MDTLSAVVDPRASAPGNYTISYSASASGCMCGPSGTVNAVTTATISILSLPSLSVLGTSSLCLGSSITKTVTSASTYSFSTGAQTSTVLLNPSSTTTYSVTGTDPSGCSQTLAFKAYVANCMGLDETNLGQKIKVFPNPNNGDFSIEGDEEIQLLLVNESGQKLRGILLNAENGFKTNISHLAKGVYILKPVSGSDEAGFKIVGGVVY